MDRRTLLSSAAAAGLLAQLGVSGAAGAAAPDAGRPPRILLRSSWQTVNIGDVAHTPGVLALLEKHVPDAEVQLWPVDVREGVADMLRARFPKLRIINPASADEVRAAFAHNDFLLHGSGAYLVAADDVARWRTETGKPYGVYGITLNGQDEKFGLGSRVLDLINGASFIYLRDPVSLQYVRSRGVRTPVVEFGPDGAFATDVRNDDAARSFLRSNKLTEGEFLCVIPRYRRTPYWEINNRPMTEEEKTQDAFNQQMKEHDHAPLRRAIVEVVRQTGLKVLVCPEDRSQVRLGKELLVDPLPADVKESVVWRDRFWSLTSALGVYNLSAGMLSNEQHSPIMCIGHGIPAILCRWSQQTVKGTMWRQIGLDEWLFDHDEEGSADGIVAATLAMVKDLPAARRKARTARSYVLTRQQTTMAQVAKVVGA